MKLIKKLSAVLIACVLIVCTFSSCTLSSVFNYTLEGSWKELDNYIGMYQFNSDGTFKISAVGYVVEGTYEFEQGEQTTVNEKKTVSGNLSMEYKTITYTDSNGKEVTEDFYFSYVTTETIINQVEKVNPFNEENVTIVEEEEIIETEHKGYLTAPITGTYTIVQQNKNPEKLTIELDDFYLDYVDENGETQRMFAKDMFVSGGDWSFERSYDVI